MSKIPLFLRFAAIFFFSSFSSGEQLIHSRHLLHQPFLPVVTAAPPPYQSPSSSEPPSPSPRSHHHHKKQPATPPPHEKHIFSSVANPPPPPPSPPHINPFFPSSDPSSTTSHPPPPPRPATLATFPANISSLLFPTNNNPSKPNKNRHIAKLVAVAISVVFAAVLLSLFVVFIVFLRRTSHRRRSSPAFDTKSTRSDSHQLFNAAPSDGSLKHKHPPKYTSSNTSSEFLYLGTLVNSRSGGLDQQKSPISVSGSVTGVLEVPHPTSSSSSYSQYNKLGSPELRPLPPLPKLTDFTLTYKSSEQLNPKREDFDRDDNENDEFYSPRGSSGRKQIPTHVMSSIMKDSGVDQISGRSINGSSSCSSTNSVSSLNGSPATSLKANSLSPRHSLHSQNSLNGRVSKHPRPTRSPPPPPPPPQFLEIPAVTSLSPPRGDSGDDIEKLQEKKDETLKPKLKPLHWDKVRASSSRATVWDQIKSNSFQLNEEMIETLFKAHDPSSRTRDAENASLVQSANQENQFLDPRKSHNIAILLRALNVTTDEVCEALIEGNSDTLGPELLECLLKMAPTKEEENKLKELKEDESPSKLGPAEKFIKALLKIPFAFKRINAMLYIINFKSEIEYLKTSFNTLEAACGELKNTRMFLKLLEAVLKTGNRMNIGTNRGDAHAFKLDTLLKLVDIKGADGKTTLLHFVVQEMIKSEGARVSSTPIQTDNTPEQSAFQDDLELKKLGLQVVSSLSSQLLNVKKAAAMESNSLCNETVEIVNGILKVKEVIEELKVGRFVDSMNMFLNKAEKEIIEIQSHETNVMKMVKEVTEYFHGNSESHPFRIFTVVRDFLTILDQVCKEVGRVNERTVYGSVTVTPLFAVANNDNSRLSHSGSVVNDDD